VVGFCVAIAAIGAIRRSGRQHVHQGLSRSAIPTRANDLGGVAEPLEQFTPDNRLIVLPEVAA
jgi:hypothetical protein